MRATFTKLLLPEISLTQSNNSNNNSLISRNSHEPLISLHSISLHGDGKTLGAYEMTLHKAPTLDEIFTSLLAGRESRGVLRSLTTPDKCLVDFSSNDYLSISRRPEVKKAYIAKIQQLGEGETGDFALGSGGSRLLDGNTDLAESLERSLASFHGAEAGLLFNSGYEANTGLLASAPQAGDVVIFDEAIHASVHSGIKLSRAGLAIPFTHNCVWEKQAECCDRGHTTGQSPILNTQSLEGTLQRLLEGECGAAILAGQRHVFITVEALYSMDGDIAPLKHIVECVERYLPLGNGLIVVDEAHSNGILGDRGQGLVCQLGLENRVWASVLTFGKALGCSGGTLHISFASLYLEMCVNIDLFHVAIVLCSSITRAYLINYARTFIYTTAMGPPGLLSIQVAHQFVASSHADILRRKLQGLIDRVQARLGGMFRHLDPSGTIVRLRVASSKSPIVPIFTDRAKSLAAHCQYHGLMVRAIVAPTVPQGTDRVRICLHAGNSDGDCDRLCTAVEQWVLLQTISGQQASPEPVQNIKNRL